MTLYKKRRHIGFLSSLLCVAALLTGCGQNNSSPGASPLVTGGAPSPAVSASAGDAASKELEYYNGGGEIRLSGDGASFTGSGAEVSGSRVTIKSEGTYTVTGTLTNGQISVEAGENDKVLILLAGADITCSDGPAIYAKSGDKITVGLKEGTNNRLADGATYSDEEANAVLYSKSDLKIAGTGTLTINASFDNGIHGKDDLKIYGGTITISAVNDGVKGKDSVKIEYATLSITSGGDGIQSDNEEDTEKGFIEIGSGSIDIKSTGKAIKAENYITINGGTIKITTEDDAIHAEKTLTINDGDIDIAKCTEGLEAAAIYLNGGKATLIASDDGINGAGGDTAATQGAQNMTPPDAAAGTAAQGAPDMTAPNAQALPAGRPGGFGGQGGFGGGHGGFMSSSSGTLEINGGTWIVNAAGDGVDVNGSVKMTGGTVIVHGPTNSGNGALDYDGTFEMTGGCLLAAGSTGMAMTPSKVEGVCTANLTLSRMQAGELVHIEDASGNEIVTFASEKAWQSLVLSTSALKQGETYKVYTGGSYSGGTEQGGVYSGGTYSGGTLLKSFTQSAATTAVR